MVRDDNYSTQYEDSAPEESFAFNPPVVGGLEQAAPVDTVAQDYWNQQAALQQAEWERQAAVQQAEWERQAAARESTTTATGGLPVTTTTDTSNAGNVLTGNILAGASWNSTNNTLGSDLTALNGQQTLNTAVGGATSADTLNQLNTFIDSGGSFAPGATVFLQTGGVDMLQGVDDNTIRNNIDQIVSTLGAQGVNVVLTASPRAGSITDVVNNNFETGPASFYSDIAANHSNVAVVDSMGNILKDKSLLRDALHTNAAGEQIYNQSVIDAYNSLVNKGVNPTTAIEIATQTANTTGDATAVAEAPTGALPTTPTVTQPVIDNLSNQILASSNTSVWKGEGFGSAQANANDMAKILSGIGITDIKDFGQITKQVPTYSYDQDGNQTQTGTETVTTYGNKKTGQEVPQTYGERQTGNAFGGTYTGEGNTAYRAQFDANGNPLFYTTGASSSNIGEYAPLLAAASFIPGVAPFAMAANAAIAIDQGDVIGGLASLAGLGGFTDVATGLRVTNALKNGDTSGLIMSLMQNPTVSNAAGSTMLTDTISLRDASNALNIANNVSTGNYAGALSSAGMLTGSKDVTTAGAALRVVNAINSGNETAIINAIGGLNNTINAGNNITNKNVASGLANNVAKSTETTVGDFEDTEVTRLKGLGYTKEQIQEYFKKLDNLTSPLDTVDTDTTNTSAQAPSGLQLAGLSGTTSDAGNGLIEVSGTPIFAGTDKASSVRPPAGYALASQNDPVMGEPARYDENDRILPKSDGTYYDITQNAWFKPTGEFNLSNMVGGLDSVKDSTSSDADEITIVGDRPTNYYPEQSGLTIGGNQLVDPTLNQLLNRSVAPTSGGADQNTITITGDRPVTPSVTTPDTVTITGDRPTTPTVTTPDTVTVTGERPVDTVAPDTTVINNNDGTTTTIVIVDDRPVIHTCESGYQWDEASKACVPIGTIPEVVITAPPVVNPPVVTPPVVTPPVVRPPAVTPSVVKKPVTTSPLSSAGTPAPKLDSSEQMLKGAPAQKRMELAKLQQLFASLTPEMAAILSERGFAPPKYKEDTKDEKDDSSEKENRSVFGNLSDELYKPTFMATGGKVFESMMPKFIEHPKHIAAAPVVGTGGVDSPLKLAALKHLYQSIGKPMKPLGELAKGGLPQKYAEAAPKGHKPEFITGLTGYYAQGDGTGQSDDIPAMLHDGDYVIDADAVAALGDGSSKAGAQALSQFQSKVPHKMSTGGQAVPAKIADGEYVFPEAFVTAIGGGDNKQGAKRLDAMREELRAHKRSAPTSKIPPKAKSPLDYLRMAKG